MKLDKKICIKDYTKFEPSEIYEMARHIAITKGHVSIGLNDKKNIGDSIIHIFSNVPKNNINIIHTLEEPKIKIANHQELVNIINDLPMGEIKIYNQWPVKLILSSNEIHEGELLFHQLTEDPLTNNKFLFGKWILKLVELYKHSIAQPKTDPRYEPFR
ncbi:MAG: hypothetical protein WC812_03240 [Candidatus Pacearchaeota archaeon]|jgi:hypothetical protein